MADTLTIERRKEKGSFIYVRSGSKVNDDALTKWIDELTVPPAWKDVKISHSKRSKVYATGYDQAGRKQAIYSPAFRDKQERLKFDKILRFAEGLPSLRMQISTDLNRKKLGKQKVVACVVKLIDTAYFRVGNEQYAQENNSYGITTLRSKHMSIEQDSVVFEFRGKSGKDHVKKIKDKQIAAIVKKLDDMPGYEIFTYKDSNNTIHKISSADVNEYIKNNMGEEFSAKDFRTWAGTLLATTELLAQDYHDTKKQRQKMVSSIVKNVAKQLGNTPAIARGSYIDPRVIASYVDSSDISKVKAAMTKMKPRKYMSRDEQCVLRLLN